MAPMPLTVSSVGAVAPEPRLARVAGRYTLGEQLGVGGMGTVHRAHDEATGRVVAFKQLLSSRVGERRKALEALFEREYHTLVRLKHPRIIEVYDYGLLETGPYYTMELLEGDDLQRLSPLPYQLACRHLRDVASSLALIHAHRLVHRDISPRNVRLTPDGRAKLIDFGALAGFGLAKSVVGTPPFMAPEILQQMPLDQRTDLFALGAVGYFALTGRQAYPARRFEELTELWKRPPIAPSKLVPDIPLALDTLILSLLSIDPLARPSSTAAVIDQLTALGGLAPEEHEHAAESYLSSGGMVGRTGELEWGRKRVARALAGTGAEVVIEGPAGVGKTRLLHEIGLEAQLRGVTVLKADARATPSFFGVAAALSAQLLAIYPEPARRAARPHAGVLGHLAPELHDKLDQPLTELASSPSERRARFQTALHEWFLAVSEQRTLLLAVDNVQVADDGSAAFLAALGSEARAHHVIVLVTQRSGEAVTAPVPVKALRKRSSRLKLSSLGAGACEELVRSLFGDVANTGRVGRLLFEKSGGNPQQCMDLAHFLVKRKIAKYAAGTWVLPLDVSHDELPSRMEEIVAAKLADLSGPARALVEALSIHTRPVSLERCLELSDNERDASALGALDELVAAQILLTEGGSYQFGQQSVREGVLAQMDEVRRRGMHLRAAETSLSAAGEDLAARMQAAWHLLHGGAEGRGADLLASVGRAFLKTQGGASECVDQIVQALSAAVEVYERQKRSDYEIAGLLFTLVPLGFYCSDWRITTRYALRSFELGLKITGLGLAHRLRRLLGKKLALFLAFWLARIRFARERKRGLEYDLRGAIGSFCTMVPATMGTFGTCIDTAGGERILGKLQPLELLDNEQFASLMFAWGQAQILVASGCDRESLEAFARVAQRLRDPRLAALMGEGHRRTMYGGALFSLAFLECYCSSQRALEIAREMEGLGVRIWAMAADQVRLIYHAYRGELEHVQRYRERVELFAIQGSSTWQTEMFLPVALLDADMLSADTIAARRTWEQLARLAEDVVSLRAYADAAHAGYLTLRGELTTAIDLYHKLLPALPPRRRMAWLTTRTHFALALNLADRHARAKEVLLDALSVTQPEDGVVALHFLEARRQLALAEGGLGNHAEAVRQLEQLLVDYGALDNPLLIGLLHKARAEIALWMGDRDSFETHLDEMERRFRPTGNPALIAQWERLAERAVRSGLRRSLESEPRQDDLVYPASAARTLAELSAAPDRSEYALQLLMQRAQAKAGYLYLLQGGAMHLAAASAPHEPPQGLETQLMEQAARLEHDTDESVDAATMIEASGLAREQRELQALIALVPATVEVFVPATTPSMPVEGSNTIYIRSDAPLRVEGVHRTFVLSTQSAEKRVVVGGVILEMTSRDQHRLHPELLAAVAGALYERLATSAALTEG